MNKILFEHNDMIYSVCVNVNNKYKSWYYVLIDNKTVTTTTKLLDTLKMLFDNEFKSDYIIECVYDTKLNDINENKCIYEHKT